MAVSNVAPIELLVKGTTERIDILVTDADGNAIDATELSLKVFDVGENQIIADDFFAGYGDPPTPPTQIVKPASTTGRYYFPFGDISFDVNNHTDNVGDYLFQWRVVAAAGSEAVHPIQVVRVVPVRAMRYLPSLRLRIDKAAKDISDDPNDPVFLGYTDSMLIEFLNQGVSLINCWQPYPTFDSIGSFPVIHHALLLLAAEWCALSSQEVFAIDTDINFSDLANTFQISHQPQLAARLNTIWQQLTQLTPLMKRQYVVSGSVRVEMNASARIMNLITAAPVGSTFRGLFTA